MPLPHFGNNFAWIQEVIKDFKEKINLPEYILERLKIRVGGGSWTGNPIKIYIEDTVTNKEYNVLYGSDYSVVKYDIYKSLRKEKISKLFSN